MLQTFKQKAGQCIVSSSQRVIGTSAWEKIKPLEDHFASRGDFYQHAQGSNVRIPL